MSNKSVEGSEPDIPEVPTNSDGSSTTPLPYVVSDEVPQYRMYQVMNIPAQQSWAWADDPAEFLPGEASPTTISALDELLESRLLKPKVQPKVESELIPFSELREGDFLLYQCNNKGEAQSSWKVKVSKQNGVWGYMANSGWGDKGFRAFPKMAKCQVRLPRPPPPENEFGPVSP